MKNETNVEVNPYSAIKYISTGISSEIVFYGTTYWLKEEMPLGNGVSLWALFREDFCYQYAANSTNEAVEAAIEYLCQYYNEKV